MRNPGIEPVPPRWQRGILTLDQLQVAKMAILLLFCFTNST